MFMEKENISAANDEELKAHHRELLSQVLIRVEGGLETMICVMGTKIDDQGESRTDVYAAASTRSMLQAATALIASVAEDAVGADIEALVLLKIVKILTALTQDNWRDPSRAETEEIHAELFPRKHGWTRI